MNFPNACGRNQTQTGLQVRCSATYASEIHEELIYLSAFNIFLSITAVLGNILILVALRKESSLHPPSKLMFKSLATTDLCVVTVVSWMSVTTYIHTYNLNLNTIKISKLTSLWGRVLNKIHKKLELKIKIILIKYNFDKNK